MTSSKKMTRRNVHASGRGRAKTWRAKWKEWRAGVPQTYPAGTKKRFFYETMSVDKRGAHVYEERFLPTDAFDGTVCSPAVFQKNMDVARDPYVAAFPNLSGDAILVVPKPQARGQCFLSIKDFMDTATPEHQSRFWKTVEKQVQRLLRKHEKIYVSTHGLQVPYFHLRLDTVPKNLETKAFL
jgi:hypothetical protein